MKTCLNSSNLDISSVAARKITILIVTKAHQESLKNQYLLIQNDLVRTGLTFELFLNALSQ